MQTEMSKDKIKEIILSELPRIIEEDPDIRRFVLDITRGKYADKKKTGDRIEMILEELKRDREENSRKWAAQEKRWAEWEKK